MKHYRVCVCVCMYETERDGAETNRQRDREMWGQQRDQGEKVPAKSETLFEDIIVNNSDDHI